MRTAILAGGASSRMGTDKALVDLGGIPMVDCVAHALRSVSEPFLVGRSGSIRGIPAVPDEGAPRQGPLAGVVTALKHAGDDLLVAGVDQPYLERQVVAALVERFDGSRPVVPVAEGVLQVTCAVYPLAFLAKARTHLAHHSSLWRALRDTEIDAWEDWPGDGRSWFSIDTPEAVSDAMERFGQPPM